MTKQDVLTRLCALMTKVAEERFNMEYRGMGVAHDCFCAAQQENGAFYQMDERVIKYVEGVVEEKLGK